MSDVDDINHWMESGNVPVPYAGHYLPDSILRSQVREFMRQTGQEVRVKPGVPSDNIVRLRAKLIVEEIYELLESMFSSSKSRIAKHQIYCQKRAMMNLIEDALIEVNMIELADALADIDYVVEGTRLAFGIDGGPIADEVHRANMRKLDGPIASDGKQLKPKGWVPPNIAGCLREQSW